MPSPVTFFRLIDTARAPQRADRSAHGTLPTRASRYCEAVTTASAFGWHLFAPMDFQLLWDGSEIFWTYSGAETWLPLEAAQFPGMLARFDAAAPAQLRGCAPPFLTALPEPGVVQLWTGLFARTAADWSLLIRPLANLPRTGGFELYEGIVETDRWFGPLFTNLRLTRTHTPVRFHAHLPIAQVQPLPRHAYDDTVLDHATIVPTLADLTETEWNGYLQSVVHPNDDPDRPMGQYATTTRRRRKSGCPMARGA